MSQGKSEVEDDVHTGGRREKTPVPCDRGLFLGALDAVMVTVYVPDNYAASGLMRVLI